MSNRISYLTDEEPSKRHHKVYKFFDKLPPSLSFNCHINVIFLILSYISSVNILAVAHGCQIGWVSPTMPYLKSEDTHLTNGMINSDQISWIGSLLSLGALFSVLFVGFAIEFFGKKNTLIFLLFPNVISWIIFYFSTNLIHLYVGRLFAGITSGGLFRITPLFTGEIAESHVRGKLKSF